MKKLATTFLALLLIFSYASAEEYSPKLGMTMADFIQKFNALPAQLEAPYVALTEPSFWAAIGRNAAWFQPDSSANTYIVLISDEPGRRHSLDVGLDKIQIYVKNSKQFVSLFCVAYRCAQLFASDVLGTSMAPFSLMNAVSYYHESNAKSKNLVAYSPLIVDDVSLVLSFYDGADGFYFQISKSDDL